MNKEIKIDFVGVGVERSGTTWIYECLREHPEICVSSSKETNFFKDDKMYGRGMDFYSTFFTHCSGKNIIGEYNPWYIIDDKWLKRIKGKFPNAKIIVSFRNPVEKTFSLYHMKNSYKSLKHKSFEEFIDDEQYIERALYAKKLEFLYSLFARKNVLVLIYEDIVKDSDKFLENLYEFLEVNPKFKPNIINKIHNSPEARNFLKRGFVIFLSKIKRQFFLKFNLGIKFMHFIQSKKFYGKLERYLAKGEKRVTSRPEMEEETRAKLQKIFKKDINNFSKLINRDLSDWK